MAGNFSRAFIFEHPHSQNPGIATEFMVWLTGILEYIRVSGSYETPVHRLLPQTTHCRLVDISDSFDVVWLSVILDDIKDLFRVVYSEEGSSDRPL